MNPILDYDSTMKISQLPPAQQPDYTRTRIAFRVLVAVATCLLVVLGSVSIQNGTAPSPLTSGGALLAGGCVFVLADILRAFLVVAIPPGLFILSLAGLLAN
ncbi:hypothetical protein ACI48D_11855 [Massilia sp. LXY-6]|uniref:hypothetical protein n=1 Tax=Massilia sp. LXY-6 TaxID=3379823 RepID=UPI003EDFBEE7